MRNFTSRRFMVAAFVLILISLIIMSFMGRPVPAPVPPSAAAPADASTAATQPASATGETAAPARAVPDASPAAPAAPESAQKPLRPSLDQVIGLTLRRRGGEDIASLEKADNGWSLVGQGIPADKEVVETLLQQLLTAERKPVPAEQAALLSTALDNGGGIEVLVHSTPPQSENGPEAGDGYSFLLGLNPAGNFDSVYAQADDADSLFLLRADPRGTLGMWNNVADESPDLSALLDKQLLHFEPRDAVGLTAAYPDNSLRLTKDEAGWQMESETGWRDIEVDAAAVQRWLADLAAMQTSGGWPERGAAARGLDNPDFAITIALADGSEKLIKAVKIPSGEAWIETSDYPGLAYPLTDWRFSLYFERDNALFPDLVPAYRPEDIRLLDVRRDGESVKFRHTEQGWKANAVPFPARNGRLDELARLLANWKPAALASRTFPTARAEYAGPAIDVILADGNVVQYRLAGLHPLLQRRYVIVNGMLPFATGEDEAWEMFPTFAEVLELGQVFGSLHPDEVQGVRYEVDGGEVLFEAGRDADGRWLAATDRGEDVLSEDEVTQLVRTPAEWNIAGISPQNAEEFYFTLGATRLTITSADGEHAVFIPEMPEEGEGVIPILRDGRQVYTAYAKDLSQWMDSVQSVAGRIDSAAEAEEQARRQREEEEAQQREALLEEQRKAELAAEEERLAAERQAQQEAEEQARREEQLQRERRLRAAEDEREAEAAAMQSEQPAASISTLPVAEPAPEQGRTRLPDVIGSEAEPESSAGGMDDVASDSGEASIPEQNLPESALPDESAAADEESEPIAIEDIHTNADQGDPGLIDVVDGELGGEMDGADAGIVSDDDDDSSISFSTVEMMEDADEDDVLDAAENVAADPDPEQAMAQEDDDFQMAEPLAVEHFSDLPFTAAELMPNVSEDEQVESPLDSAVNAEPLEQPEQAEPEPVLNENRME